MSVPANYSPVISDTAPPNDADGFIAFTQMWRLNDPENSNAQTEKRSGIGPLLFLNKFEL